MPSNEEKLYVLKQKIGNHIRRLPDEDIINGIHQLSPEDKTFMVLTNKRILLAKTSSHLKNDYVLDSIYNRSISSIKASSAGLIELLIIGIISLSIGAILFIVGLLLSLTITAISSIFFITGIILVLVYYFYCRREIVIFSGNRESKINTSSLNLDEFKVLLNDILCQADAINVPIRRNDFAGPDTCDNSFSGEAIEQSSNT
jgi:hypothetical protein